MLFNLNSLTVHYYSFIWFTCFVQITVYYSWYILYMLHTFQRNLFKLSVLHLLNMYNKSRMIEYFWYYFSFQESNRQVISSTNMVVHKCHYCNLTEPKSTE